MSSTGLARAAADFIDTGWDARDRLTSDLAAVNAAGLSPPAPRSKATIVHPIPLARARGYPLLGYLVACPCAFTSGNGCWTRYHADR
jgi:hypothetical protein